MIPITHKHFYESHPTHYDVITDYIRENHKEVPIVGIEPETLIDVEFSDCYLDDNGDLFVPNFYHWSYKGSDENTDPDEYSPVYNPSKPTLTKLEIENLVAAVEQPELKDKVRNI